MNKTGWIVALVVAVVFGGGGYWYGSTHAQSSQASFAGRAGGAGGMFVSRGGAGGPGGATFGTILSVGNGTMTIQLPSSTSTNAQSGTKLVLFDSSTQVDEMQQVGTSKLAQGQNVVIAGTPNSDGSISAQSIQIRPAGAVSFNRGG